MLATPPDCGVANINYERKPLAVPGTWNTGTNYADSRYQLPRIDNLSAQNMFECRIGSHERGSHLVNQACVGPGEIFVNTVEYFQLDKDFLNAVDAAQGVSDLM